LGGGRKGEIDTPEEVGGWRSGSGKEESVVKMDMDGAGCECGSAAGIT
jgi:hypothetical protein